jgi:Bacterial type II/III secretion system short domain
MMPKGDPRSRTQRAMPTEAIRRLKLHRTGFAVLSILTALILGTLPVSGKSADANNAAQDAAAIKNLFEGKLAETGVLVQVKPRPKGQFLIVLTGKVADKEEVTRLERLASEIKPKNVTIKSELTVAPEKEETSLWNLTYFLRSQFSSESSTSSARSTRVPELVKALNDLYGKPDRPVALLAGGGSLLLRGTKSQLRQIRSFLALLDSPWPQVQITLWALQVSGSQEQIASKVDRLASDVRATHDAIVTVQRELARIAPEGGLQGCAVDLERKVACRESPIFLPVSGPLSLNESLILLMVQADRQDKVESLSDWVEHQFPKQVAEVGPNYHPFPRLKEVLQWRGKKADCEAFSNFLYAMNGYSGDREGAPEAVVRTGTILDRVLKAAMDAYAVDMSELFLDPLLKRAQNGAAKGKGDGVSLVGRSRIVVTSGLTSGLTPEMSSSVEISRPKPFGKELLDRAFPAKEGKNPELTGADRILAGFSAGQALLLAAALSEPEPRFAKVAPGIDVKVRPTVLPDGAAARLTIDARFGVTTTLLDPEAGSDTLNEPPAPTISSHRVETDAAVEVFDLFDISSFSMTTSHPRAPFSVPILGRLPILGRAFQWPRKPKVTNHESIILVNTVVLPRAVNLSLFYRLWDFERRPRPKDCDGNAGL